MKKGKKSESEILRQKAEELLKKNSEKPMYNFLKPNYSNSFTSLRYIK